MRVNSFIYLLNEVVTFPFLMSNIPSLKVSLYLQKNIVLVFVFQPVAANYKKSTGFSIVLGVTAGKQSTNSICWRKYWSSKDKEQF